MSSPRTTARTTQVATSDPVKNAELRASADVIEGSLQDRSSRQLLKQLNEKKFSGLLDLTFSGRRKRMTFSVGEVVRIETNSLPELLGQRMKSLGWLSDIEVEQCLKHQREKDAAKSFGKWALELFPLDAQQVEDLCRSQFLESTIQALSWTKGTYKLESRAVAADRLAPVLPLAIVIHSVHALTTILPAPLGALFDDPSAGLTPWRPQSGMVETGQHSLAAIVAGCRVMRVNGTLTLRRGPRLVEIVFKQGIPLTLYEGTFAFPKQSVLLRRVNEDSEKQFVSFLYEVFGWATAHAYFKAATYATSASEEREVTVTHLVDGESSDHARDTMDFEARSHFLAGRDSWLDVWIWKHVQKLQAYLSRD